MARTIKSNSFASVIRAYLASHQFQSLAKSTQDGYRTYLKTAEHPEVLGALPVGVVRPSVIVQFLDGFADRPGAKQRALVAIKAVEGWAIVRDLLPYPITTGIKQADAGDGHRPWTEAQVAIAEQYCSPQISRAITLASNTGQRGSDLVRMRWSDIARHEGRLGINVKQKKTGLELWVPFTEDLIEKIKSWQRGPTHLLLDKCGHPWSQRKVLYNAWRRERDERPELSGHAGLVLHGLRATAVVRLRRAGAPATQISDLVGLSAKMVERYCRHADQRASALAAVHYLDRERNVGDKKKESA